MQTNLLTVSDMLLKSLNAFQHTMTSEDMASALVGIARLQLRCSFPGGGSAPGSFLEALPRTLINMDSVQVANCMWALGKYGVTWDSLPYRVQKAYKAAMVRVGPKMTPLAVANTIHGNFLSCRFLLYHKIRNSYPLGGLIDMSSPFRLPLLSVLHHII